MTQPDLIQLRGVTREYEMGKVVVRALRGVDLSLTEPGEVVALCGPSGSGKSTLLNIAGCLDRPDAGEVKVLGHNVLKMNDDELSKLRNHSIGFVFQTFNLIPVLSAYENVEYPLLLAGEKASVRRQRTQDMLRAVGLESHSQHQPAQLSGGQQQRVAIARALVTHPQLVLADEPTANLDTATSLAILELMEKMRRMLGCTFLFATHDTRLLRFVDRTLYVVDGQVNDALPPELDNPGDDVAGILFKPEGPMKASSRVVAAHAGA